VIRLVLEMRTLVLDDQLRDPAAAERLSQAGVPAVLARGGHLGLGRVLELLDGAPGRLEMGLELGLFVHGRPRAVLSRGEGILGTDKPPTCVVDRSGGLLELRDVGRAGFSVAAQ
jgi:hypothetical protein